MKNDFTSSKTDATDPYAVSLARTGWTLLVICTFISVLCISRPVAARSTEGHLEDTILRLDPYWPTTRLEALPPYHQSNDKERSPDLGYPIATAVLKEDHQALRQISEDSHLHRNIAMLIAAEQGKLDVVQFLIELGEPVQKELPKGLAKIYDLDCYSAMDCAARNDQVETLQYLRRRGAAVDRPLFDSGRTPLLAAAEWGQWRAVRFLWQQGADIQRKDSYGSTPLHHAAMLEYPVTAEVLLRAGADVDAKGNFENTPLHYAAALTHVYTAKTLILYGADVSAQNKGGKTPVEMIGRIQKMGTLPRYPYRNEMRDLLDHYENTDPSPEAKAFSRKRQGL